MATTDSTSTLARIQDIVDVSYIRTAQTAQAMNAISTILHANSEGSIPNMDNVTPGLHCALKLLAERLEDRADSDHEVMEGILEGRTA